MKFKKLREATLTKTQIKKVHDKADDLPKNDFIKRYGKDGDSVRFATATKMVKKELGIEDYEEGFKSDAQRRAAFASGYKEKGKKKNEGGPGSGPRHKEVTLTRNGKTKTVKGVAAKIFTDAGWKVKKEEVQESSIMGLNKSSAEYKAGKEAAKKGIKYDDNPHAPGVKRLNWSTGHNDFRADAMRKSGKPNYGARGQFEDTELTENISGEKVAQGYAKTIAKMTDGNDHFGARKYIADLIKDKELSQMYDSLEKAHKLTNGAGNHAISLRGKMESILKYRVGRKLRPDIAKIILGGL